MLPRFVPGRPLHPIYVATNRLARDAQAALGKLGIDKLIKPNEPLKTAEGILEVLQEHGHLIPKLGDVAERFRRHVEEFTRLLDGNFDQP